MLVAPLGFDIASKAMRAASTKFPPSGEFSRSSSRARSRAPCEIEVELDTNDFTEREICFGPPKDICVAQVPVAHEFGHTLGNIGRVHKGRSDEYDARSLFSEDVASMMHRGNELRDRHFNHLLNELRGMVPDAEFSLARLQ